MADWCELPSDILGEIALKLNFIEDFIHFSVVCHLWNHVSSMVKPEWSRAHKPTLPWLLLAEPHPEPEPKSIGKDAVEVNSGCRKIFNIRKNKCYEMMLPQISGKRCWGSSCGWIVMFGSDEDVQLFNPITKAHLSLPSLKTVPNHPLDGLDELYGGGGRDGDDGDDGDDDDDDDDDDAFDGSGGGDDDDDYDSIIALDDDDDDEFNRDHWILKYFVRSIYVLKMPRKDNVDDFIVMVIHESFQHLAYARPGDRAWTEVVTRGKTPNQVYQVMCWNGILLILYRDGTFAYCDIEDFDPSLTGIPIKAKSYCKLAPVNNIASEVDPSGLYDGSVYIVELNGDLYAVVRHRETGDRRPLDCGNWYLTKKFEIYKHVESWEKVEDLGDFLMFVGYNYASAVHISKASNCQRNAIYFVDDEFHYYLIDGCQDARGHDMGMFDMATGEITPFYKGGDIISKYFAPIWFLPNF